MIAIKKNKEIGYSIKSIKNNREKYPLHPPSTFISKEEIKTLEKFLHWKVFLSNDRDEDPNVGNSYLYMDLTSKVGAGGLDVVAQEHNSALTKKIAPILSKAGLSVKKTAIIIWAHQYFVSMFYYKDRFQHTKNFFIPSLSALVKDVDKAIKGKD